MSASPFGGLWTYPSTECPGQYDFMFIDESRGRIVNFVVMKAEPFRQLPMRLWYRPTSPTSIVVRLRPEEPWREHVFDLNGDTLSWTVGGTVQPWGRVPQEAHPDWLEAKLAEAYSKMDEIDRASGATPGR
jgi:hypothetical protein